MSSMTEIAWNQYRRLHWLRHRVQLHCRWNNCLEGFPSSWYSRGADWKEQYDVSYWSFALSYQWIECDVLLCWVTISSKRIETSEQMSVCEVWYFQPSTSSSTALPILIGGGISPLCCISQSFRAERRRALAACFESISKPRSSGGFCPPNIVSWNACRYDGFKISKD